MKGHGFAFIATHIDIKDNLTLEVIPNYEFRRATSDEISVIKEKILDGVPQNIRNCALPYEHIIKEEVYESGTTFHPEALSVEKWKYWVIAHDNVIGNEQHELRKALALLPKDLEIGFTAHWFNSSDSEQGGSMWSPVPLHIIELYSDHDFFRKNATILTESDIHKIGEIYELITNYDKSYEFIEHALSNYMVLRRIPLKSDILAVGYFSIIESLVTHPPRLTETLDSISHQLRNKIVLLSKKFENKIDHQSRFDQIDLEKLWNKLYSYRSSIAHGGVVDFKNGKLSILKSNSDVTWYLKAIVKELIVLSCKEPEFIADLKRC